MKEFYEVGEIVVLNLNGMPDLRGINAMAVREGWRTRKDYSGKPLALKDAKGGGWSYHVSLFPQSTRDDISLRLMREESPDLIREFIAPAKESAPMDKALERDAKSEIVSIWLAYKKSNPGKVETLMMRFARFYELRKIKSISAATYAVIEGFTPRTLRNWAAAIRENGTDGVLDRRGRKKGSSVLAIAHYGDVANLTYAWALKEKKFSVKKIRDAVRIAYGDILEVIDNETGEIIEKPLPSEREFSRFIKIFKDNNKALVAKVTNPDEFKNKHMIAVGTHAEDITIPNQLWEFDASPADILCLDGRYSIYVLVDVATRRMLVLVTKTPRTQAALHLLRIAIERWGMPEWVRSDNGSDFVSYNMKRALLALGINHDICPPYSPEKKPMVERGIGTLQRDLMETLPGYIGHDIVDRKAIEARRSFAERLGEKDNKIAVAELSEGDLQIRCDEWASAIYANSRHSGIGGLTPNEKYAQYDGAIRKPKDHTSLMILMAPIVGQDGYRTYGKKGFRYKPKGADETLYYVAFGGVKVNQKYFCMTDPLDDSQLAVFSEDKNTFLCKAECLNHMTSSGRQAVAKAAKMDQKEQNKPATAIRRTIKGLDLDEYNDKRATLYVRDAEIKAAKENGNVTKLPNPVVEWSTPQMDAVAEAFRRPEEGFNASLNEAETEHQDALIINLQAHQEEQAALKPTTAADRFTRAMDIEASIKRGDAVSENDLGWLTRYSKRTEYIARKEIEDDLQIEELREKKDAG